MFPVVLVKITDMVIIFSKISIQVYNMTRKYKNCNWKTYFTVLKLLEPSLICTYTVKHEYLLFRPFTLIWAPANRFLLKCQRWWRILYWLTWKIYNFPKIFQRLHPPRKSWEISTSNVLCKKYTDSFREDFCILSFFKYIYIYILYRYKRHACVFPNQK